MTLPVTLLHLHMLHLPNPSPRVHVCVFELFDHTGYAFCFASWNPPVLTEPDVVCPSGYEVTQQHGKPL